MIFLTVFFGCGVVLGVVLLICHFAEEDTVLFGIAGGSLLPISFIFLIASLNAVQVESSNDVDTNRQLLQKSISTGSSTKTDTCFTKGSKEEYCHLLQEKTAIESILNSSEETDLSVLINRINEYNNSVTTAKIGSTDPTFGDFYSKDVDWQALELIELA